MYRQLHFMQNEPNPHPFQAQVVHQNVALVMAVILLILYENILQWMIR